MFRLLLICTALFLLYFGFTLTQSLDSKVFISLYNYNIETTFFFSLISLCLLIIFSFIVIKFLVLIIDLPIKIHSIFNNRKINNDKYYLVLAFAKYITGNKTKAGSIARKNSSCKDLKEFHDLILAETEKDIDAKIAYFQKLITSKEFAFHSSKNLAILYYDKGLYAEAENYAVKAYNLNELDNDNLITLMHCYGQLSLWRKFAFIANKMTKLYNRQSLPETSKTRHLFKPIYREEFVGNTSPRTAAYTNDRADASTGLTYKLPLEIEFQKMSITDYYLLAARQEINNSNQANAIDYLESAINSNFVSTELIEFYLNLNNKLDDKKKIKILKNAFYHTPSLEIIKLFKKFTPLSDEQVYEELTKDLDTKKDEILILAIKAYLEV